MTQDFYKTSIDEAAFKIGILPRSVRRLAEKGIIKGKKEITTKGIQWFLNSESVEIVAKRKNEQEEKNKRHRTASDILGQPRSSGIITEKSIEPELTFVSFLKEQLKIKDEVISKLLECQQADKILIKQILNDIKELKGYASDNPSQPRSTADTENN